jgi:hypothetical protein
MQRLIRNMSSCAPGVDSPPGGSIQTKLTMSRPGDAQEREADQAADTVMRMPGAADSPKPAISSSPSTTNAQRMCADCEEEETHRTPGPEVHRKEQATGTPPVTPLVAASIQSLRGGGTALPETTRGFFEPRFGADFAGVRVHTDDRVEKTAQSLGAKAFTVGHDIAFGRGQYAPGSSEGRRLLAHELTHVLQQGAGSGVVQRQEDPDAPDPLESLVEDLVSAVQDPLAEVILRPPKSRKARKTTPELVLKQRWPKIRAWIVDQTFGGKKPPVPPDDFPGLADPGITERLGALSKDDRKAVASAVRDVLVSDVGSETPETYLEEFNRLDPAAQGNMEPGDDPIVGYVAMREGLKATFGSIDALNKYFKTLVPPNFPPGAKVRGQRTLVHPELKTALERATALLKSKDPKLLDAVVASISDVETLGSKDKDKGKTKGKGKGKKGPKHGYWSTNIRENRNQPTQIGNHSFGFAIDINADFNPNLPDFPWDLVQRLTGFDVKGPDVASVRPGQGYDVALQAAQRFKDASDRYHAVFETEANLQKAMSDQAEKAGIPVPAAELFKAVVAASERGKAGEAGLTALKALLLDAMKKEDARKAQAASNGGFGDPGTSIQIAAHEDPPVLHTIVSGLKSKIGSRAGLERFMPLIRKQLLDVADKPLPSDKKSELAILFSRGVVADLRRVPAYIREYEMPAAISRRLTPGLMVADTAELAGFLVKMHQLFISTRIQSGKLAGQKIAPSPTLAGVAAHGFMNLMPELVAALTSKEGGNLLWLGSTKGTKDWMHFELPNPPKITPQGEWP